MTSNGVAQGAAIGPVPGDGAMSGSNVNGGNDVQDTSNVSKVSNGRMRQNVLPEADGGSSQLPRASSRQTVLHNQGETLYQTLVFFFFFFFFFCSAVVFAGQSRGFSRTLQRLG